MKTLSHALKVILPIFLFSIMSTTSIAKPIQSATPIILAENSSLMVAILGTERRQERRGTRHERRDDRQEGRQERRDDRQEGREERRDDRQERRDDRRGY
jgi:hypothetical protein